MNNNLKLSQDKNNKKWCCIWFTNWS